jgi:hypothetical protein
MLNGFLFTVDPVNREFLFIHETILEYLSAEYLVKHPDAIENIPTNTLGNWDLTFAFVFELETNPSHSFLQKIWSMHPLLVSAAVRNDANLRSLSIDEFEDPWLRGLLRAMRGDPVQETLLIAQTYGSHPNKKINGQLEQKEFWYIGTSHLRGKKRLDRLEALMVDHHEPWADLLASAFRGKPEIIAKLMDEHIPLLASVGIYPNKMCKDKTNNWQEIQNIVQTFIDAADNKTLDFDIILRGMSYGYIPCVQIDDGYFQSIIPKKRLIVRFFNRWAIRETRKYSTINIFNDYAYSVLESIFFRENPKKKLELIYALHPATINLFIKYKIISIDEFLIEHKKEWVNHVSPINIVAMIKSGIFEVNDISDERKQTLLDQASPTETSDMVRNNIISVDDISDERKQTLLDQASPTEISDMVRNNIISVGDISDERKQTLLDQASPTEISDMVRNNIISVDDISDEHKQTLLDQASSTEISDMVRNNIISVDDISDEHKQTLLDHASSTEISDMVRNNVTIQLRQAA